MRKRTAIALALLALAGVAAGPPPADAAVSDAVIIALNSIHLKRDVDVDGDVVVNDAAVLPTLSPGFELKIDRGAALADDARADSIDLASTATVAGVIECNDGIRVICSGLDLPVFETLPAFRPALPGDGSGGNCEPQGDCFVDEGETKTLAPGAYGAITLAKTATLVLEGGGYDVVSVQPVSSSGPPCNTFPCRTIRFDGVTQLRVAGGFDLGRFSNVSAGTDLFGRDLVVYVSGDAHFGQGSVVEANFYLEATCVAEDADGVCIEFAGLFDMDRDSTLDGSVIALDVDIDRESTLDLNSAFNFAPVADPQTVITSGGDASFNLTATDADGDTLTFTLVSGPSIGTLSGLPASDAANPTASVPVSYTGGTDGVFDQFVFMVDDGKGGTDIAVVDINPSDDPPDPPDLPGILAKDDSLEVAQGAVGVEITLVAAAPIAIGDLEFAITVGPDQGGAVTAPVSSAETPVRSATVEYTPLPAFTGIETFTFEACEVALPTNCDQATVTIEVQPAAPPVPPVALDQSVTTGVDTSVEINLVSPAGTSAPPDGRSCTQDSDCADGFVCVDGACVPE